MPYHGQPELNGRPPLGVCSPPHSRGAGPQCVREVGQDPQSEPANENERKGKAHSRKHASLPRTARATC